MAFKCLGCSWTMLWGFLEILLVVSSYQTKKVVRIGDDLKLNCPSQNGSNITWWFDGTSLSNNTIHSNGSTLLYIFNISQKNQGIYRCGSSWQQGMNVTVLVGDLPSPPRHLFTTSYEFDKILHWTATDSTGGLPTWYTVHIDCIYPPNCQHPDKSDALYVPEILDSCNSKHVDGKKYLCNLASTNLFREYKATVYAENQLGNSSASVIFQRPSGINPDTTPAPPKDIKAKEVQPGKVRLTWRRQKEEYAIITYYRIVYRDERTNINQTWPKDLAGSETSVIIGNLNADTSYTFYVMRQFRTNLTTSPFSAPAVARLHIKKEDPDQAPQDLKCSQIKDSSSNVSTVLLTWKPPSKKHHNGPLTRYKIFYSTSRSNKSLNVPIIVNASQTKSNLTFPKEHKAINIYMKACNEHGCSGISDSCIVKGYAYSKKIKIPNSSKKVGIIVAVVVAVMCAAILIIVLSYCSIFRKKKTTQDQNASQVNLPILDDHGYVDYSEPENNEDEHEYDRPSV